MTAPAPFCRYPLRAFLLLGLAPILLGSCDMGPQGTRYPNSAPVVRITGGPLDGTRQSYTARIYWSGYDDDGIVSHYEYALDPPALVFDEEEISHPETAPGLTLQVLPGPSQDADTLRVSKEVDGHLYSFDWVETTEFSRVFTFVTPDADSSYAGGLPSPSSTYSGFHTVYVRAQDNEGEYSDFDRIAYTATTYTPSSVITRPDIEAEILSVGPTLTLTLDGSDPDSPDARRKPVGYLYKLLRLDQLDPPIPIIAVSSPNILFSKGDPTWHYQNADSTQLTVLLAPPGQYVMGVRAVDLVGAVEPFLDWGRNAFKFQAFVEGGRPDLIVREAALGTFPRREGATFRGTGRVEEADTPLGLDLHFSWSATAESYGGTIEAYSWGLDVPDLDREGPNSGWHPWGPDTRTPSALSIPTPGIHVFYVRARDLGGVVSMGTIILNVIGTSFERELLYVDDSLDGTYPRDSQQDAFWRDLFDGYGPISSGQISEFHVHGDDDRLAVPRNPTLAYLFSHRMVIWSCNGQGFNGQCSLLNATDLQPLLGPYLSAGGKLWVEGPVNLAAMVPSTNGVTVDFSYPKDMTKIPSSFAYRFMKIRSERVNNDKGNDNRNTLLQVRPIDPAQPIYGGMDVDTGKLHPIQALVGGVGFSDAIFGPMFTEQDPEFRGEMDSLYVYGAAGPLKLGLPSAYENRLVAIRWHDPDVGREQGRIQWFGFPMYFMKMEQAQDTFNRSMDWFREETLPPK